MEFISCKTADLISLLKVYDMALVQTEGTELVKAGEQVHAKSAVDTARQMIEIMRGNEGSAELYPYEEIDAIEEYFGLSA